MNGFINGFEGDYAVVNFESRQMNDIMWRELPVGLKEGDAITCDDRSSKDESLPPLSDRNKGVGFSSLYRRENIVCRAKGRVISLRICCRCSDKVKISTNHDTFPLTSQESCEMI